MKALYGWAAGVLGLVLVGFLAYSPEPPSVEEPETAPPPVLLSQVQIKEFKGGRLKVRLNAVSAQMFSDLEEVELSSLHGEVLAEQPGQPSTFLWAKQGRLEGQKKLLTLSGEIKIELPRGQLLLTEQLFFDQNQDLLWGELPVRFEGGAETGVAQGLKYRFQDDLMTLVEPVLETVL
ncbi:MAG: LPS export ABC transporter periplasmic protein LptC [Candidatus Lambdaproteobacteria bacterium RIFOXYD1_FULL_56_27]|uniref:LPS export ABC transporter periplasmic protein LptC n=1 Tax=Candidatus Lambdaproteobacteria bacterium RIFOXYD2_FULL_56_26 TaxID=1817773 RepID=A0A1F6H1Y5_9PROT|nr:MAG: LPS export ABC transporter periplasmic protein LptC [Candidatus Lambdaproteobacteria bacterium RIFOXYC1_FULL_56_13]OGH04356.1 MAG: LPS export ABC transporter periplasmic protein LptC [Candidatus Lambdaproteobacteria bacterium RIFOXYD2_FULL_56_26]OGH08669.1 MAG: LPS export ABC transporter periplasmic protein LptC [Candidatus Lambdaproteobacteria bacterium RIFOXYD1_FULL_56_27]